MKSGRHYLWTEINAREYATLMRLARRDGINLSNLIRRCINAVLHEEGLDGELFEERVRVPPQARTKRAGQP